MPHDAAPDRPAHNQPDPSRTGRGRLAQDRLAQDRAVVNHKGARTGARAIPDDRRKLRRSPQTVHRGQHWTLRDGQPGQADSSRRPLRRRVAMMARPARVRIRRRNPWVLARRRLFGWKVRLLTVGLHRLDDRGGHDAVDPHAGWSPGATCSPTNGGYARECGDRRPGPLHGTDRGPCRSNRHGPANPRDGATPGRVRTGEGVERAHILGTNAPAHGTFSDDTPGSIVVPPQALLGSPTGSARRRANALLHRSPDSVHEKSATELLRHQPVRPAAPAHGAMPYTVVDNYVDSARWAQSTVCRSGSPAVGPSTTLGQPR